MRAWLLVCSCYLQPTVFDGGARIPSLPPPPVAPPPDNPVGCITKERVGRRSSIYWLGKRQVSSDEVKRALAAFPPAVPHLTRARRAERLSLAMYLTGAALGVGSVAGTLAWLSEDGSSNRPLYLLFGVFLGYGLAFSSLPLALHGDRERRLAIDVFNDTAADEHRCPP
jgi:hypothetical protein